ncbi:cytochrome P450 [Roseisolibacter agri]|uniref:Cytochrome P450 n=1 Tax=Roseisolibacter agri TaxID=2014610 RepID=A0AA37V154_9BACT|nr:cytochrome P450 [Roseisolibacter agri]GLC25645.1 cytochrome P450 [Roseisolibacter agri]
MSATAAWHDARVNAAAHPFGWPLTRLVRCAGPVVRVPGLGLVVSGAALCHEVLTRDRDFAKNGPGSFAATMTRFLGPAALSNMDGDAHQRLRARVADLLAPAPAEALLALAEAPLARLRAELTAGDAVDLVPRARALSGRVALDMLGVTADDGDDSALALLALGERIAAGLGFRAPSARRARAMHADCDRLAAMARARWDAPDVAPRSVIGRLRALGLTFEEARGVLSILLLAGAITTAAALPRLVALLVDGQQWEAARARAQYDLGAVLAEGLRFAAPVPATVRIAARDVSLDGRRVREGTRVVVLACNAARDPALFPDPDRFDVTRTHDARARHLWFGAGPHFCIGFALAQRQLRRTLEALLAVPGTPRIVHRRAARGALIPAYASLVLRVEPA